MDAKEICRQTRKLASHSLYRVLEQALHSSAPISEAALRDAWLAEMRRSNSVFPDGWYAPPPHGMGVLFASDQDVDRANYESLRPSEIWPRDDIFLDRQRGLIYLYASPVDAATGIIGDFGVTLYLGANPEIQALLKQCLQLDREIFEYARVGMKLSDIAHYAKKLMGEQGMSNEVLSTSDATGTNIGHSIPSPVQDCTAEDVSRISQRRIFVNEIEDYQLQPGDMITIEPRPSLPDHPNLPTSLSYHTIALFGKPGESELLTGFDKLFSLCNMNYMD